ncbi:type ISP restriction/modification enzyme [Corynebacterium flavescens]|uniref:type ISP restriction/modification enzyme n=1 Tax=Corynebacterium flavescens TaxID=28028 RepID=UPI00264715B5|nr:type ISP restriction/modification enzyme [Corynebacterium flavescens]MDN6430768.1 DEAD/DEAH box helicase family protein [Corynebacterium flavescens]MDN6475217.1 DEAD/DEAH box helicase family protein [Corynebacterium flavescens]MDN6822655.1 DEAD/DEAH box helicase family protein [Corynebacterium flavescens]
MSNFSEALTQLRENQPKAKYGIAFEKLMVNYFRADPTLANEYDEVCRWTDWKYNGGKADTGIDLVAHRIEDDSWTAIQCKFYLESTPIQKSNIDSFFEASGHSFQTEKGAEHFANRLIISTTDRWSANAEQALEDQIIPTNRIGLASIADSPIDWDIAFPGSEIQINLTKRETFGPRPHQQTAIDNAIKGFETHDRGQLIMACGTGKTFTALRLAERVANDNGGRARVLFLVPSISLLSQTLKEWTAQSQLDLRSYAVCSDNKVSKKAEDIAAYDLEVPVSTDGKSIAERFNRGKRFKGLHVVFSTYQSLPAVHDAQENGLEDFDLVICDEAHRTTGVTLYGEDPSNFTRIHDAEYIKASKRLYMTATPRLYDDNIKGKAAEHSAEVMSMDDEGTYGPEFHRLGFGEAVEKGLLTDYKVLVITVDEEATADALARGGGNEVNLSLASAMIGAWNGLAKRSGKEQGTKSGFEIDASPMQRTVAFAKDIKTSKAIAESYPYLIDSYRDSLEEHAALNDVSLLNVDLDVAVQHVDGGMNAMERNTKISWLESSMKDDETRILTNARCLSEGVDVPALDSVIFFNPRNSMVDVVQSVGRVMRKSEGKDYGYIILPVAVPPNTSPAAALNDNTRFKVVWQILNALRAHDDRFNAKVNSIALNEGNVNGLPIEVEHTGDPKKKLKDAETSNTDAYQDSSEITQQIALFSLEQWQEAMYTKLVDKVGTRTYWEDWAEDVATIAKAQITRIRAIVDNADKKLKHEFDVFVEGLRGNLNDSITEDEAISMLSQHLITAPVFNALFTEYDFTEHNPVAQVMSRMVNALSDANLESETESLEKFYESVGDGVRLSMVEDFSAIYVFNLRGNQRTAGEESRKEGGKVFGSGSRSTVAITIGIKFEDKTNCEIHYYDVGEYLSAKEKLAIVETSSFENIEWKSVSPNEQGDWINQRDARYSTWPALADAETSYFSISSNGASTARDAWVYGFDKSKITDKVSHTIKHIKFLQKSLEARTMAELMLDPSALDPQKVKWSDGLEKKIANRVHFEYSAENFRVSSYRPFCTQNLYFDPCLIERPGKMHQFFPTDKHPNLGFGMNAKSGSAPYTTLATDKIPNLQFAAGAGNPTQFFARFSWQLQHEDGKLFGAETTHQDDEQSVYGQIGEVVNGFVRVDNITDDIKKLFRRSLGLDISGDDIFHFVYGKLHDPTYRTTYSADLKKMLPHIEIPIDRSEFDKFASSGKQLIALHIAYEKVKPWPLKFTIKGDEADKETWRVTKMKWRRIKDPETGKTVDDMTTLIYNDKVTIDKIPSEANEYMLGSRSALSWLIDRYQISQDTKGKSGIVNDPNDWADEVGNPRYIADLIAKVTRVAVETVQIVNGLEG